MFVEAFSPTGEAQVLEHPTRLVHGVGGSGAHSVVRAPLSNRGEFLQESLHSGLCEEMNAVESRVDLHRLEIFLDPVRLILEQSRVEERSAV